MELLSFHIQLKKIINVIDSLADGALLQADLGNRISELNIKFLDTYVTKKHIKTNRLILIINQHLLETATATYYPF